MAAEGQYLKDFTEVNWELRWDIIEAAVSLAKNYRQLRNLPLTDFKISKKELDSYIHEVAKNRGYTSSDDLFHDLNVGKIQNSIIVLGQKLIAMDHNPGLGTYSERYIGQGKFGKVKLGMDKDKNLYAIKSERGRPTQVSEREQAIMLKIGVLVGFVHRVDKLGIKEKELSVMTLLPGVELKRCLDHRDLIHYNFSALEKMIIGLGIVCAINKLNEQGVAHRDIKPANILIDLNQLPKKINLENIDNYLNSLDPTCNFSKLIHVIDWGLSTEIPINGDEVMLSDLTQASMSHTAPEFYVSKTCSRHSESYAVADLLMKNLGIDCPLLRIMCPYEIRRKVIEFEKASLELVMLRNGFKNEKDQAKKQEFRKSISELKSKKETIHVELKALLDYYPPASRPTLRNLNDALSVMIQEALIDIEKANELREGVIEEADADNYLKIRTSFVKPRSVKDKGPQSSAGPSIVKKIKP